MLPLSIATPLQLLLVMSSAHWNLLSAWSKAGVGTSLVLELKKPPEASGQAPKKASPRLAFDMGATPCFDEAIPARYVFVSHGHVDHVGALFGHARAHAVTCGGSTPTYFVPAQLLPQLEQCRDAMSLLDASNMHPDEEDGGRNESLIKMNLVPVRPGDVVPLKGISYGSKTSFFARAIEVDHAGHPALGFVIGSRTVSGLKKEYQNLDGPSLRDLVKSGVSIKEDPVEKIEVAYTGDACARGLMRSLPDSSHNVGQMFQAELLLCELTFLDSSEDEEQRRLASERGHIHINDIEGIFSSHKADSAASEQRPQHIVFYHLSAKYQPAGRALDLIANGLPLELRDRCQVAVSSMLTQGEKSDDNSFAKLIRPNGCISLADYVSWKNGAT